MERKIAFTTSGEDLDSPLDPRFGRCRKFLIYNLEKETFEIVENQKSFNAAQGAGIQAAETVARLGVEAVVTGHCGPNAFRVLSAAGIDIYSCQSETVSAALESFCSGALTKAQSADVEGHWV